MLGGLLEEFYGSLTAANAISDIIARTQTGNLHIALYDLSGNDMYVSFAAKSDEDTEEKYAYQRSFTSIDMESLFAEAAP